jgi:hypothetical protein
VSTKLIPKFIVASIVGIVSDKVSEVIGIAGAEFSNRDFYASNDGRTSAGVPGGLGDSIRELRTILKKAGFKLAGVKPEDTPLNPFIPTASALGVGSAGIGADDFGPDLNYSQEAWQAASPFHKVYVETDSNQPHTESSKAWEDEIGALFDSAP